MNKLPKCFISHCADDVSGITTALMRLLLTLYPLLPRDSFFYTSDEKSRVLPGNVLDNDLRDAISRSDVMIAVITDSYIRSVKCIAEISAFWYTGKKIIPLIYNGSRGIEFWNRLNDNTSIYLEPHKPAAVGLFLAAMEASGFHAAPDSAEALTGAFLTGSCQAVPQRRFIGCGDEYEKIIRTCDSFGIDTITDQPLKHEELIRQLSDKKHIYIVSTTGANLINKLVTDFIPDGLCRGVNFTVLLPNRDSAFCNDVADIEEDISVERLSNEFGNVMTNLQNVVNRVYTENSGASGQIRVGCCYTLLRQTILLGTNDRTAWGWLSITLPPRRTVNRTPSFAFSDIIGSEEDTFADSVMHHISSIIRVAKQRGAFFTLQPQQNALTEFFPEQASARQYWRELQRTAQSNTMSHRELYDDILIEVAAQHPLKPNGKPAGEFRARLNEAIRLYRRLQTDYPDAEVHIYVPGSRHRFEGVNDKVSLSKAGTDYLKQRGIREEDLFGEDMNLRYKGKKGVYNSADECYVAARIFTEQKYKLLYCVCSPSQMLRKKLFYLAFGVVPRFITVPDIDDFHDDIHEIFTAIPNVLYRDHTWQDEDSVFGRRAREERIPTD